jgi:tetratricopeptide (TPR) repeat protein
MSIRVSELCLRSAYIHRGNALAALGREEEARASYEKVLPIFEKEPRVGRVDWERNSTYVNIGNTYSRQGNFDKADEYYNIAKKLGQDHLDHVDGNKMDGMGIMIVAMRARAFAMKKAGKEEEGKKQLREVLELQMKLNVELEKQQAELAAFAEQQAAAQAALGGGEPGLLPEP